MQDMLEVKNFIYRLDKFLFGLRLRIKILSDDEFMKLIKECDLQQQLFALYFRYF